ncbi:MAG: thiamine pyrophosphate-dependent enzyme [Candidatus Promineofilum sp.]|uniref:alpha-ketoacid dehydrogenase subunit alpha/beta n=1 Tax=Promineifilum sp. TaxID=2664178 RepID=UPI002411EEFE|nr:thiamine pyrophosphate-dependent enzyme [Promineifilum sp.]
MKETDKTPFDWQEVARLALVSRMMDELEERELTPKGLVTYQFSARGHELGQILLAQLLTKPMDAASVYYRSRPFVLGSGLTAEEALASDMARAGGMSEGRDVGVVFNMPRRGRALILPMAADVGSQFTPAAGWAQAICYRRSVLGEEVVADSIAVVFGGEGSVASNGFWSALNMATTMELPLLFVIEDNSYAISVKSRLQTPGANIASNLASFHGLTIWDGDGCDPATTADLVDTAIAYVRQGNGPGLLRLTVPRLSGHSSVDNQAYKTEEERAEEWARDPIVALKRYLVPAQIDDDGWAKLESEAAAEVKGANDAAQAQPQPDPARITERVWAAGSPSPIAGGVAAQKAALPAGTDVPHPPDPRRLTMVEAIRRTLDVELGVNPRCLVFGEDVGLKGGVHAATLGLQAKHGDARVFDTSLSEEGIIGRAVGMALAGLMPVPEIQFRKYADPATEQLHNIGSLRWRTGGRFAVPLVVRMPGGFRRIGDPWHSVTDEAAFAHSVGWRVAYPSNAEDAVGLLRAALRGEDPVMFFEHRAMLDAASARRAYPGDQYVLPFGRGHVVRQGDALTIVTWGAMVERCVAAADETGRDIEIIDLRTIVPWDKALVLESVRKTSRCLIVHEDFQLAGFGAEIAAVVADQAFLDLDAPVHRLAAPSIPVPFNTGLMDGMIPRVDQIGERIRWLLEF